MHIPTVRCLLSDKVWHLIQQGVMLSSWSQRWLLGFYFLLGIVFLWYIWQTKPYQWKILPFGLVTASRVFNYLPEPKLSLWWACLGLHKNFSSWTLALLFLRTVLGYGECVHMPANWLCFWDIPVGGFICCRCRRLQSIFLCLLWARPIFVPKVMQNFAICVMWLRATYSLLVVSSLISHFSLFKPCFNFSNCLSCNSVWFFVASLAWCGYHYGCYAPSLGFLFFAFWFTFVILQNLIRVSVKC